MLIPTLILLAQLGSTVPRPWGTYITTPQGRVYIAVPNAQGGNTLYPAYKPDGTPVIVLPLPLPTTQPSPSDLAPSYPIPNVEGEFDEE